MDRILDRILDRARRHFSPQELGRLALVLRRHGYMDRQHMAEEAVLEVKSQRADTRGFHRFAAKRLQDNQYSVRGGEISEGGFPGAGVLFWCATLQDAETVMSLIKDDPRFFCLRIVREHHEE